MVPHFPVLLSTRHSHGSLPTAAVQGLAIGFVLLRVEGLVEEGKL